MKGSFANGLTFHVTDIDRAGEGQALFSAATLPLTQDRDVTKLHAVNKRHISLFEEQLDEESVEHRLEEVYIWAEVDRLVKKQPNVKDAMATRGLQIHAFVYDKEKTRCLRLVDTVG